MRESHSRLSGRPRSAYGEAERRRERKELSRERPREGRREREGKTAARETRQRRTRAFELVPLVPAVERTISWREARGAAKRGGREEGTRE